MSLLPFDYALLATSRGTVGRGVSGRVAVFADGALANAKSSGANTNVNPRTRAPGE